MTGVTPLCALQDVVAFALGGEPAAGPVHERDDAVHVGIGFEEARAAYRLGHEAGHRGGAVHARQHANIVARADLAAAASEAGKGRAQLGRQQDLLAGILGEGIIALELGERTVLRVDVAARGDVLAGKADDLSKFEDGLSLGDRLRRHLVPA
jgi:hypothetical protein